MDPSNCPDEKYNYRELVRLTAQDLPTFGPLQDFLSRGNDDLDSEITLLEFKGAHDYGNQVGEGNQDTTKKIRSQNIDPKYPQGIEILVEALQREDGHQLLLVQNLTPTVTSLLGTHWNVPPDFFLAHLENSNWYSMQNIPQNLPGLSSVQSLDKFVRLQFVGPREIEIDNSSGSRLDPGKGDMRLDDRIHEDPKTASVRRVAGGFNMFAGPDREDGRKREPNNPVAVVRNSITVWFDIDGDNWRRGIVLFDPPFVAENSRYKNKKNSIYRSFLPRKAPPFYSADDVDKRRSYKDSFEKCLQKNPHINAAGNFKPFVLLEDICRIIASEWLVFNTYVERELNNVESWFEEGEKHYDQKTLQALLQHLMRARRRVTKYDTLVSDQLQLCPAHWNHESSHRDHESPQNAHVTTPEAHGTMPDAHVTTPKAHGTASSSGCPMRHSSTPVQSLSTLLDFQQVRNHLSHNKTRISQAIKLVTSLMAVHLNELVVEQNKTLLDHNELTAKQNRLSEARNSSLAFLTGVTSFLLPFTTVAAFLAIPTDSGFGPGSTKQWIFWVSAGVLAVSLMLAFGLDFWYEKGKAVCSKVEQTQRQSGAQQSGSPHDETTTQATRDTTNMLMKGHVIKAVSNPFRRRTTKNKSEGFEA